MGSARASARGDPRAVRDLLAVARRTIERRGLLKGGERVVVAVSGGADSLAMLHVLQRMSSELGLELHVAHLDHRMRADSARDAAFVARQAARLGLPATVRALDAPPDRAGRSPEEAAREVRLAFLEEVAEGIAAARIATGHTLDDRAETVLMRVLQGAGTRGLAGIPPRRGPFVRPLIDARRTQTEAFCRALRLRPRSDPTNQDRSILRNLIRGETLPALRATINARADEALARLADVAADEDALLEGLLDEAGLEPERDGPDVRIPLDRLEALPVALQRRAIRRLAARAGLDLGFDHAEAVRRLALEGKSGQTADLPGPLNARRGYGFLLIGRVPSPAIPAAPVELAVPGETDLAAWDLEARSWVSAAPPLSWPDGRMRCVLDADRIVFPLRVGPPRPGDRFRPLGAGGMKKVGDFFTDRKVPRERRGEVPLVADADGRIVWVVGHRIDDRVKVRSSTRRFLWLSMQQPDGGGGAP